MNKKIIATVSAAALACGVVFALSGCAQDDENFAPEVPTTQTSTVTQGVDEWKEKQELSANAQGEEKTENGEASNENVDRETLIVQVTELEGNKVTCIEGNIVEPKEGGEGYGFQPESEEAITFESDQVTYVDSAGDELLEIPELSVGSVIVVAGPASQGNIAVETVEIGDLGYLAGAYAE
ncbi:hypothetical protein AALA21_04780 [Eggerthellaceae bacterium 3-80]|nr:hypothetical protein D7W09_03420 [bacterium D16-34]